MHPLAWFLIHLLNSAQYGLLLFLVPAGLTLVFGIMGVFGLALEFVFFRRLYERDHLYQVLLTYGLILRIEETRSILWGDHPHGVPVPAMLDWSFRLTDTLSYPA